MVILNFYIFSIFSFHVLLLDIFVLLVFGLLLLKFSLSHHFPLLVLFYLISLVRIAFLSCLLF